MYPVYRQVLTQALAAPDKAAVISGRRTLTYSQLVSDVARCATNLIARYGIRPGDRIVLLADSNADFVCAYFAVHSIGAVCAPLDPHINTDRLADIVGRLAPRLIVADATLPAQRAPQIRFDELLHADLPAPGPAATDTALERPADILFTTGTTGRSKGVVLSQRALATSSSHINAFIGTRSHAVEVLPLPLSHSFGLGRVRCVLSLGATLVLVPGLANPAKVSAAMLQHRASGFASVPTGIAILLQDEGRILAPFADQLEYVEIGSSPMPIEHKKLLMRLLPKTRICMHYGLTEASRSAYISFHDDKDKLDSIGRPSRGVEMRVTAIPDEDAVDAQGDVQGQIEIRGGHLMSEYWQDPDLTEKTMHGGWLRTGDIGRRDEDGYFYLSTRISDIINVGGRKVSPNEIEDTLLKHPAIEECVCLGIPDPQGLSGQIIVVYLVGRPGAGALPAFSELAKLLRQGLEPHKIPRQFHWIEQIPKSGSGKVLRQQLRDSSANLSSP